MVVANGAHPVAGEIRAVGSFDHRGFLSRKTRPVLRWCAGEPEEVDKLGGAMVLIIINS